jgi:hypothetical protein
MLVCSLSDIARMAFREHDKSPARLGLWGQFTFDSPFGNIIDDICHR